VAPWCCRPVQPQLAELLLRSPLPSSLRRSLAFELSSPRHLRGLRVLFPPRSGAGPVTVSPGLSARPLCALPSPPPTLSCGLLQRVRLLGCSVSQGVSRCGFWGARRGVPTNRFPQQHLWAPHVNGGQADCFSRVSAPWQGVRVPPRTPAPQNTWEPASQTQPSCFPISTRTFTSKLPVKFPVRKAAAFGCRRLSVYAEAGHPPVCGPDGAFSLVCRRLGPRGQVGWRSARQQAAEEDNSRENLTSPSDATFPQSLESKCWIFVRFSSMGGKYKNSYYFHNFVSEIWSHMLVCLV